MCSIVTTPFRVRQRSPTGEKHVGHDTGHLLVRLSDSAAARLFARSAMSTLSAKHLLDI